MREERFLPARAGTSGADVFPHPPGSFRRSAAMNVWKLTRCCVFLALVLIPWRSGPDMASEKRRDTNLERPPMH